MVAASMSSTRPKVSVHALRDVPTAPKAHGAGTILVTNRDACPWPDPPPRLDTDERSDAAMRDGDAALAPGEDALDDDTEACSERSEMERQ